MARRPRFDLAGVAQHVVQRGNNRLPCFLDDDDRQRYLQCLHEVLSRFDCRLHAYVLMSNHVHLLVTPGSAGAVSKLMHTFARNYTALFNGRHGRTGTLWEGRFKACLVDSQRYVLACMRYIELNPVRAWMVAQPADYPWSSYAQCVGLRVDKLITPHALYWALDNTPFAREAAYSALVQAGISGAEQQALTDAALSGWALGDADFLAQLQQRTERRVTKGRAGRPSRIPEVQTE